MRRSIAGYWELPSGTDILCNGDNLRRRGEEKRMEKRTKRRREGGREEEVNFLGISESEKNIVNLI